MIQPDPVTILVGGAVITIDAERRVLDPGAVAIQKDRIIEVASPDDLISRYPEATRIDLSGHVIMPGLVDSHGHAGHGLTKALNDGGNWLDLVAELYFQASDDEFWRAESYLSALEHLEFGVTTSLSMTGSMPRVDDARYAVQAAAGYADLGLRHIVALGTPSGAPPWSYTDISTGETHSVDLDRALATTADAIDQLHGTHDGRISCYVGPSALVNEIDANGRASDFSTASMRGVVELANQKQVGIHAHAFSGQVQAAAAAVPDILSPKLCLAHCAGISLDEIRIMAETGVSATHGPLTNAYVRDRFPVVEALDAGVNVVISTDGSGPDRSFDLLSMGRIAAQLQRVHFNDTSILPAGKTLEMMTIDAAKALGMDSEIGSLEAGKKADIIALNLRTARMYPRMLIPQRVVFVGSGLDVEFMMVDGEVLMANRQMPGVDIDRILDDAHKAAVETLARAGREDVVKEPANMWSAVRY